MYIVREYRSEDLPALYALDQSCFAPGIAYTLDELAYFIHHRDATTLVAEGPEGAAGFSVIERLRSRGKVYAHLITIDILPWCRKQGIGGQLMRAMEHRLRQAEVLRVRLEVAVDNAAAQGFYAHFGYRECGRSANYYLNSIDALVMEKLLAPSDAEPE